MFFLLFVFYTAMESFIYSSVKFKAAGLDIASIKFRDIYKGVFGLFPKMLLFNVISLLLTAIPVGLVMLPFLIVRDSVESDIAFYVATVLAVLAVIVLTVPYNMVLPNIMLGKGGFFKSLLCFGYEEMGKSFCAFTCCYNNSECCFVFVAFTCFNFFNDTVFCLI